MAAGGRSLPFPLLLRLQEIDAALDLLEAGGIQPLALHHHADAVLDGVLANLEHGSLALTQGLACAALEAVLQVNDLDATRQALQGLDGVNARIEGPEGVQP